MKQPRSPHHTVHSTESDPRAKALLLAIALSAGAFGVQVVGAWVTGSLSLIGDTAHVFTDLLSLIMAWLAVHLARRPLTESRSWGLYRLEVLASFVNGLLLLAVGMRIIWEAVERFRNPVEVLAVPLMVVASAGLALNLLSAWVLFRKMGEAGCAHGDHHHHHEDRNLKSAMLHVISDAMGSVVVIAGGIFLQATGEAWIDPALAVALSTAILWFSGKVLLDSGHVLLEGTPRHIPVAELSRWLRQTDPRVEGFEDLHIWEITSRMYALSVEVRVRANEFSVADQIRQKIVTGLEEKFGIAHATVVVKPSS